MMAVNTRIRPEVSARRFSKNEEKVKLLYSSVAVLRRGAMSCQFRNIKRRRPIPAQDWRRPSKKIVAGYPINSQLLMSLAWAAKAVSQKFIDRFPMIKSVFVEIFLYERTVTKIRTEKYRAIALNSRNSSEEVKFTL
jgi:hypothetical protein